MDEFQLCGDGELLPVNVPCPPPYSAPYYDYAHRNRPLSPEEGTNTVYAASSSKAAGGASISSGAVAGIIITGGFIFFALCLFAVKCRAKFILGYGRASRNHGYLAGDQLLMSSGHDMAVNFAGCGLEKRLVSLLPVYEYVGSQQEGQAEGKERLQECAVCLSLFEEKETVRVLPKCHHVFHIHCIDRWFEAHANCPLCRERITLQTIQLSLKYSPKLDHDQQPFHPALVSPQSLAYDQSCDDLFDQPATDAACEQRAAADRECAGPTHRLCDQCDHKSPSIPAAAITAGARCACGKQSSFYKHSLDPSTAGAGDGSQAGAGAKGVDHELWTVHQAQEDCTKTGECSLSILQACAGDHRAAPRFSLPSERRLSHTYEKPALRANHYAISTTWRSQGSLLRKSLSTGSMDVESHGKPSAHPPLHDAPTCLARSSTLRLLL